jgi:DNA-binding XRE family transcriptional regulator
MLGLTVEELAKLAGVSPDTVVDFERDTVTPRKTTVDAIWKALDRQGIEFLDNNGIRFKHRNTETFEGVDGFAEFYDVVYDHLRRNGGEACLAGSSAKVFSRYRKQANLHRERMTELVKRRDDVSVRVLAEEGDTSYLANLAYAEYRWQKKEYFSPTAFYVFGDCLALITFEHNPPPLVILIRLAPIAEAYRRSFELAWSLAKVPPSLVRKDKDAS